MPSTWPLTVIRGDAVGGPAARLQDGLTGCLVEYGRGAHVPHCDLPAGGGRLRHDLASRSGAGVRTTASASV